MLLNKQQITKKIKKTIKICIETNENENRTTQNLWDSVKVVLRGRFIAYFDCLFYFFGDLLFIQKHVVRPPYVCILNNFFLVVDSNLTAW